MFQKPKNLFCLLARICSGITENDKVVAVEDFIDVGNILTKSWVVGRGSWVALYGPFWRVLGV